MTFLVDIPTTGEIQVSAFFRIHGQCSPRTYVQNDSRILLRRQVPALGKRVGLDISDYLFAILRHREDDVFKSVGVLYSYLFKNMDAKKLDAFGDELHKHFERPKSARHNMWSAWSAVISLQHPTEASHVPKAGEIMLRVFFKQETGKIIQEKSWDLIISGVQKVAESIGFTVKPLLFGVIRHVEASITKPIGVVSRFTFKNMAYDKYLKMEAALGREFGQKAFPLEPCWSKYETALFRNLRM